MGSAVGYNFTKATSAHRHVARGTGRPASLSGLPASRFTLVELAVTLEFTCHPEALRGRLTTDEAAMVSWWD